MDLKQAHSQKEVASNLNKVLKLDGESFLLSTQLRNVLPQLQVYTN